MSIDWRTLILQTVNILILVWLLQKFFWRPVAAIIAQRQLAAKNLLTEAEQKRFEATAKLAAIEQTRAGFAREREAVLTTAQALAAATRAASLEEAGKAARTMEATARAAIAAERAAAETAWKMSACQLAVDIAQRLAARLEGQAVRRAFLDGLLREISNLPEAMRQTVAAEGMPLDAVSAAPLEAAEQADTATRIAQAFGGVLPIVFKTEPALLAGIELRGKNLLLRNSWRADLDQILADITREH